MMNKRPGGSYLKAKPTSKPQLVSKTTQKGEETLKETSSKKVVNND